jgi:hypothetical protein
MRVTGWLHQFDQQPAGDVVAQVAALGLDRLAVKALDGASWMARFDRGPGAIAGVADLVALEARLGADAIGLDAWVNVTKADLGAAAQLWRQILGAIKGRLFLDLEPYAGFWGDDSDLAAVAKALEGLDRSRLGVTFDPRRSDWRGLDAVMNAVSYASPQIYAHDWLAGAEQLVDRWGASPSGASKAPSDEGARAGSSLSTRHSSLAWEPLVSVSESVAEWLGIVTAERFQATSFGVWLLPIADASQRELIGLIHQPSATGLADPDFRAYAPRSGTWREACANLKGVADDALETGRKLAALAGQAAGIWGTR